MDPAQTQAQVQHVILAMMPIFALLAICIMAIVIIPLWRICTKAGLAGALSLLVILWPIGLFILLYIIAFSNWKVVPAPPQYGGLPPAYPPTYPPGPPAPPAQY
jgi:hypothetical protein